MNALNKETNNSKDTFMLLIKGIENDLYNIAKNKVNNINDVDDIIQETIIKIYKNFDNLKHKEYFKTWSIKILLNECNKNYRANNKQLLLFDKILHKKSKHEDSSIIDFEDNFCFKQLLKNLSFAEQNIFILYYECNYSIKEISKILNINENTIKTKLKRSKLKIKEKYMKGGLNNYEK